MGPVLILDTNVLVAALRSAQGASHALLNLVGKGDFTIGVTTPLVLEYEAVVSRDLVALGLTADDLRDLLDYLCHVGRRSAVRFRLRPSLPDPKDEMLLEAAVACEAAWIVSHNVRDLAAGVVQFGIEVIKPGEALRRLGVKRWTN
jgi:predicted nucleic acid-binding protein